MSCVDVKDLTPNLLGFILRVPCKTHEAMRILFIWFDIVKAFEIASIT